MLKINYLLKNLCSIKLTNYLPITNIGTKPDTNEHYDVIILGGAATGLSMAASISKQQVLCDKKILVLDGSPTFKGYLKDGYANRVFALSKGTVELLYSINAWETISSIRYQTVKQMQVWDACSNALINFTYDDFRDDIAYIVESDVLTHGILEEVKKCGSIKLQNDVRIDNVQLPNNEQDVSTVTLKDGTNFSCELLIGADGANSIVRKQMGVDNFTLSYNQMGVIATLELCEPGNNNTAWQRFLPNGVIALLPVSDNLSSIVWSTNTEMAKKLLALPESEFIDAVNNAFLKQYSNNKFIDNILDSVQSFIEKNGPETIRQFPPQIKQLYNNSRAAFPLGFGHTSTYVSKGVALIGDAAHRIHPLAGQGLNLGFGDVKCLTNALANASYSGIRLGDTYHLLSYERQRLQHNVPVMVGIHGLHCLYNTDCAPIVFCRSLGLQLTHSFFPFKKFLLDKAMQ